MKIVINEKQFALIESFIGEAKAKLSNNVMSVLGNTVLRFLDVVGKGKSTSFELASGNHFVLTCVDESDYNFTFTVAEDKAKVLKHWETLTIKMNPGNGEDGGTAGEYRLNKNVITTSDDGTTFDLRFIGEKPSGVKGNVNIRKIRSVSHASTPAKPEIKADEPTGSVDEPSSGATATSDGKEDATAAFKMISNDPNLKKAFYEQPTLWKLFKAELTGKKATGKGIITVLDLLNKYTEKESKNKFGATFIKGEPLKIIFLDSVTVTYKKNDGEGSYTFDSYDLTGYNPVVRYSLGENPKFGGSIEKGVTYNLEALDRMEGVKDGFLCKLTIKPFKQPKVVHDSRVEIKIIRGKDSPGYSPVQ